MTIQLFRIFMTDSSTTLTWMYATMMHTTYPISSSTIFLTFFYYVGNCLLIYYVNIYFCLIYSATNLDNSNIIKVYIYNLNHLIF